jgi:peptidoglycan L-alanyl-D-glutamate endopeptidase CwlK
MPADLNALLPAFRIRVEDLVSACRQRGVEIRPYTAMRDPVEQARLWRQSRAREEIEHKIGELRGRGAPFLAHCIEVAGACSGAHATHSIPGLSWHQWGEAVDSFWVVDGRAEWSTSRKVAGVNGYQVYAEEATKLGLDAGGLWRRFKDWPHVQLRPGSSPLGPMKLSDIDDEMSRRFA